VAGTAETAAMSFFLLRVANPVAGTAETAAMSLLTSLMATEGT
jgi:hypothetical protein